MIHAGLELQDAEPDDGRRVTLMDLGSGAAELRLSRTLSFGDAALLWQDVRARMASAHRGETLNFDVSRVSSVDGAASFRASRRFAVNVLARLRMTYVLHDEKAVILERTITIDRDVPSTTEAARADDVVTPWRTRYTAQCWTFPST